MWLRLFPFLQWLPSWSRSGHVSADFWAGLTGATVVLPQGVAFATLAGMPPEYGLYAAMVPCVVAALWGASRAMVTGPANAISLTTGPIAQKDLIDLFSRFLNKPLKYSNQSISALKRRKKPETSYTLELHQQYRFYCDDM